MLRIPRIECHTPYVRHRLQRLHDILEVHKAQTAAQVGVAVPGLEAGAQWRERFGIGTEIRRAELQQVRHH
ncbi:hypothetical protein D3C85_687790 [compost metagenome]